MAMGTPPISRYNGTRMKKCPFSGLVEGQDDLSVFSLGPDSGRVADDADAVDGLPLLADPYSDLETRGGIEDHRPGRPAYTGFEEGNQLGVLCIVLRRRIGILLRMGMNEDNCLVAKLRRFGNRDIGLGCSGGLPLEYLEKGLPRGKRPAALAGGGRLGVA